MEERKREQKVVLTQGSRGNPYRSSLVFLQRTQGLPATQRPHRNLRQDVPETCHRHTG